MALTPTPGNLPEAQTTGKYTEQVGIERGEISKKVITALAGFALSMQVGAKDQSEIPVSPDLTKLDTTSTLTIKGAPQIADSGGSASDVGGGLSGTSVAGASQRPEDGLFDDMPVLESDRYQLNFPSNGLGFQEEFLRDTGKFKGQLEQKLNSLGDEIKLKIFAYYLEGESYSTNKGQLAFLLIGYGESIMKTDGRAERIGNQIGRNCDRLSYLAERGKRADDYGKAKSEKIKKQLEATRERGRKARERGEQLDKEIEQLKWLTGTLG